VQPRRLALGALALGIALPTAPSVATAKPAPKPPPKACKQISDAEGDGVVQPTGLSSPTLDILSADISSGKKEVTGTLRLKGAAVETDNVARLGEAWNLNFTVSGVKYVFFARYTGNVTAGTPALTGGLTVGGSRSDPEATFRRVGNDLVWSVVRKAVDGLKKPKTYIEVTSANSGAGSLSADTALAKPNTRYLDRSPSCLTSP
jgi:hypothetical protein